MYEVAVNYPFSVNQALYMCRNPSYYKPFFQSI